MKKILFLLLISITLGSFEYTYGQTYKNGTHTFKFSRTESNQKRTFTERGPFRAGQVHLVNVHCYENTISLPYNTIGAWVDLANSDCGWSGANPNNQQKLVAYTYDNINQKLHVKTYFYQKIGYNILGQKIPQTTYPSGSKNVLKYVYIVP